MDEFYIDTYFNGIQELSEERRNYILNIENALRSNLKNDFDLLINIYKLYKTSDNFLYDFAIDNFVFVSGLSFSELVNKYFGFSRGYTYHLLQIADKFINFKSLDVETFRVDELKDYSISKLQELLPLTVEQVKQAFKDKKLTYKSTVAEIRQVVKSIIRPETKIAPQTDNEELSGDEGKEVETKPDPDKECLVSVVLPKEEFTFASEQALKSKISLVEYIVNLIREKMH